MKRTAKKFAFGTLAVTVMWILFEHIMGYNSTRHDIGQYTRLAPMILFWIMLVVAIYCTRRDQANTLSFSDGFQTGLIMTLIYCTGFTIIIILYNQFLNPEYYSTLKDFTMQQLREQHAPQTTIDAEMKELAMTQSGTPLSYLLLFIFASVWGIGISAIASAVLQKKAAAL